MKCKEKTTLKLSSNIIQKSKWESSPELYKPIELLPSQYLDVRNWPYMSEQQRKQVNKKLFYAEKYVCDNERYPFEEDNLKLCENCRYKDICF